MITLILSGRSTPTRPHGEAMAHLKSVHGPMVYDAPIDAGPMPSVYIQNHVLADPALPAALEAWRWDRHLVTEISFDDVDHCKASTQSPYYLENLRPDEDLFVDRASVRPLMVAKPIVEGDVRAAEYKLLVYLRSGPDHAAFLSAWSKARRTAASACAAQSVGLPLMAPGTPPAFVDGLWSLWFDTRADAETFSLRTLEDLLTGFGAALSTEPGFIVLAEEFPVARLRRENASVPEPAR